MSGFKRYQSKVFWGQMESRDLGLSPARPQPVQREDEEEMLSLSLEETVDVAESDTTDAENTTVIHIERCESPATNSLEQSTGEAAALAERSFSPASRGQRSQDSGFSDSGRSDSSGASASPRRRRRRRSSRRDRGHPRLPEVPAHTSTPKQPGRPVAYLELPPPPPPPRRINFDDHSRAASRSPECLEDFLYATEPAEDEQQPSASAARPRRPSPTPAGLDVRAPVKLWLEELHLDAEDECMATLQSKSLPKRRHRDDEPESRDLRLLTASATTAAKQMIDAAQRFDARYQQVLESMRNSKSGKVDRNLLQSIESEAAGILMKLGIAPPRRIMPQDNIRNIVIQLGRLKSTVDKAMDARLDFYIEKVVRGLEDAPREGGSAARGALAALTALGLAGGRAGASVARCSGIRALLTSLVSSGRLSSELRCACLRALASVCCCLEAVDQFVAEGGPDILAEVLAAEATPHTEKSEAAALLVQVTAPWMDRVGLPYVEPFAQPLVASLTDLACSTSCKQTLLLATAAVNNLAHSARCVGAIVKCNSIKKLLRCVKKSSGGNLCLMEQVASLVGQVARHPQARAHLAETRASVALVCFLRMQPPGLEDEYRSLEATASEALTRLCVYPEIAQQVVAVGGSDCLPRGSAECGGPAAEASAAADPPFRSTKSLRVARKLAAEQIDIARIWDTSPR